MIKNVSKYNTYSAYTRGFSRKKECLENPLCKNISDSKTLKTQKTSNIELYDLRFGALMATSGHGSDWKCHDTYLFRDFQTQDKANSYIKDVFPEDGTVFVYGPSSGQEVFAEEKSLGSKYKIIGLDPYYKITTLAEMGICSLSPSIEEESFLLEKPENLTEEQKKLQKMLFENFKPISKEEASEFIEYRKSILPKFIAGEDEQFFKRINHPNPNISFTGGPLGDIRPSLMNFYKTKTIKPSAIFARNLFYHITGNKLGIYDSSNKKFAYDTEFYLSDYKTQDLYYTALDLYNKLADNGILVLGNSSREHVFTPKKRILENEIIRFSETETGKRLIEKELYRSDLSFLKISPLEKFLREAGFEALYCGPVEGFPEMIVPLIYKKVPQALKKCL